MLFGYLIINFFDLLKSMKKIITLICFLALLSGFSGSNLEAFGSPMLSSPIITNSAATLTDNCPECAGNRLVNGNFEDGLTGWKKSGGTLESSTQYKSCGSKGATFGGSGYFYQDVENIGEGDMVTLNFYGARHETNYGQTFSIQFLNSSGNEIGTPAASQSKAINKDVDTNPWGLKLFTMTGTAPAGTVKVRVKGSQNHANAWIKMDEACLTVVKNCPECIGNKLVNGDFESGTTGWSKSGGTLASSDVYVECGEKGATFGGNGYFYQDVPNINAGDVVTLNIYGARHETNYSQKFQIQFLNSSGNEVGTPAASQTKAIDKDVDANPWGLKLYTMTGTAPAGTVKVRVKGSQNNNNAWIKLDAACLTVVKSCPDCSGNKLTNSGFESGTTGWTTSGGSLASSTDYKECGEKGAVLSGNGSFYQDVNILEFSAVTLKIFAARKTDYNHKIQLIFLDGTGAAIANQPGSQTKSIDKNIDTSPWGLKEYTITGNAPEGARKVRIQISQTNASAWVAVDAACLTVVPPVANCNCDGNKAVNGSFESGTGSWTKDVPATNYAVETSSKGCGSKYGVITGVGSIYQDVTLVPNSKVNLIIWGGTSDITKDHKFRISFIDKDGVVLSSETKEMDYLLNDNYLKEYVFQELTAPAKSVKVRVEAISSTGNTSSSTFKVDGACLKITPPDAPLPVTLVSFAVARENASAVLSWSTTTESNSSEFEVQQSENGKVWNRVGAVSATGESKELVRYHFVHNQPAEGNNFYRLKMIDNDATFSLSRIVMIHFGETSAVQLYPNPTTDYMKLTVGAGKIANVQLYNIQGVMVLETKPDSSDIVDLSRLAPGAYVVKVKQGSGVTSTRRIQIVK